MNSASHCPPSQRWAEVELAASSPVSSLDRAPKGCLEENQVKLLLPGKPQPTEVERLGREVTHTENLHRCLQSASHLRSLMVAAPAWWDLPETGLEVQSTGRTNRWEPSHQVQKPIDGRDLSMPS